MKRPNCWTIEAMMALVVLVLVVEFQPFLPTVAIAQDGGCPANSKPVKRTEANGEVIVSCQCVPEYTKFQGRCEPVEKVKLLRNAKTIRDSVTNGKKPPFQPLWDNYAANRNIVKGLVGSEENRCAIVLSMTLGFEPRENEADLEDLKIRRLLSRELGVGPEIADSQLAKRFYIRAQELANRIRDEWGDPLIIKDGKARTMIKDKKGVVLIQDAYGRPDSQGRMSIDHIDVWNGIRTGSEDAVFPRFEAAPQVWFWEIDSAPRK